MDRLERLDHHLGRRRRLMQLLMQLLMQPRRLPWGFPASHRAQSKRTCARYMKLLSQLPARAFEEVRDSQA
jgi:hypothetical protein